MFRPQYQLQKVSRQIGGKGYRAILNRRDTTNDGRTRK